MKTSSTVQNQAKNIPVPLQLATKYLILAQTFQWVKNPTELWILVKNIPVHGETSKPTT